MRKANSYYDWELQFRKEPQKNKYKENKLNSLGIPKTEYKRFIIIIIIIAFFLGTFSYCLLYYGGMRQIE